MKKLAIITTHPIQYNAPLFALLNKRNRVQIKVFYTWGESVLENKFDPGFGKVIQWDIPLLEGYPFCFVKNTANNKGSHHFNGIINPTLITEIKQFNADAVLVYGWSFKSHLKVLRYFHGKLPVFFRGDSHLLDDTVPLKRWIRKIILRYIYKHVSVAFYVGKHNKYYFLNSGLKQHQLIFAPHAIDNARFSGSMGDSAHTDRAYRRELNISEDAFVYLFAGKFESKKAPLSIIEAFQKLSFKTGVYLIMVGNGPLENEVKNAIGNDEHIKWLPFQNQQSMPSLYAACDVFVLPSVGPGETWGLAVNEAIAAGKAVVVSNKCGCHSDLVIEGENGYTFQAGNSESLIKKLADAKNLNASKVKECSKHLLTKYSFETVAQAIEEAIMNKMLSP